MKERRDVKEMKPHQTFGNYGTLDVPVIRPLSTDYGIAWFRADPSMSGLWVEIYPVKTLAEATKLAVGMVKHLEPGSRAVVLRKNGDPVPHAFYR